MRTAVESAAAAGIAADAALLAPTAGGSALGEPAAERRQTDEAHMIYEEVTSGSRTRRTLTGTARMLFALKLDGPLLIGLALVALYGLVVLYSASGQSLGTRRAAPARGSAWASSRCSCSRR